MKPLIDFADKLPSELTVLVGADHWGFELKQEIVNHLKGRGIPAEDVGPFDYDADDDYPDFANVLAAKVSRGEADCGILLCASGIGMSINANRYAYVRAALVESKEKAVSSRDHNCSNVLVVGSAKGLDTAGMLSIIDAWLATPFSKAERHARRLMKIETGSQGRQ